MKKKVNQLDVVIYGKIANSTSTLVGVVDPLLLSCWVNKTKLK